jgi:putative nucleotidyltransferase with HDIG domain
MGMLQNMIAHSRQVQRVSMFLADHISVGPINRELLSAAALLHDITKTRSLQTKEDHAATGERLIAAKGYPEVGRIIGQHILLDNYLFEGVPSEAEIVNYADKRVLHDKIATLEKRMTYLVDMYGNTKERRQMIDRLWERSVELEKRLFALLPFAPGDLAALMAEAGATPLNGSTILP